jgi:hypothetical protein
MSATIISVTVKIQDAAAGDPIRSVSEEYSTEAQKNENASVELTRLLNLPGVATSNAF